MQKTLPSSAPVIAGVLLCSLLFAGCTSRTYTTAERAATGPYEVNRNHAVVLYDPQQEREVNLRVDWPSGEGPYPVVVFSHGAFCYPQQYANVTDFWVSRGYIVIFPDHIDSPNGPKMQPQQIVKLQGSRVRDMSFVLDSLDDIEAQVPELQGRLDPSLAAVAGHSFGGMIAMIKSGLYMETQADGQPVAEADERFQAAVVMSGVGQMEPMRMMPDVPAMAANAFDGLTGPLIASGGSLDEGNVGTGVIYPWEWRMSAYTKAPEGDKYYVALENADHYLGGLICRDNKGGEDDPVAVATVRTAQVAFLDAYLKGDKAAGRWLNSADLQEISDGRVSFERK